jgi:hypothetical protein
VTLGPPEKFDCKKLSLLDELVISVEIAQKENMGLCHQWSSRVTSAATFHSEI